MAKVLVLQQGQYINGVVTLYRGDRWTLDATIYEQYANVKLPVDLTACSGVTGYFPSAATGAITVVGGISNPTAGRVLFVVPEAVTPNVALVPDASSWYVEASLATGPETIETPDYPLVIQDPSFNE